MDVASSTESHTDEFMPFMFLSPVSTVFLLYMSLIDQVVYG